MEALVDRADAALQWVHLLAYPVPRREAPRRGKQDRKGGDADDCNSLPDGEIVGGRDLDAQIGKQLQGELDALEKKYAGRGAKLATHLVEGVPYVEIVRIAKELAADMIVMDTHGRGGFSHFVLGSVAERVVRMAECPVLTVRQPKAKQRSDGPAEPEAPGALVATSSAPSG